MLDKSILRYIRSPVCILLVIPSTVYLDNNVCIPSLLFCLPPKPNRHSLFGEHTTHKKASPEHGVLGLFHRMITKPTEI
jgi:hypothetical protein